MTYANAQKELLNRLQASGWTVKAALKVPHATDPTGKLRLWFKTQAVWFTLGTHHEYKNARAIYQTGLDYRVMSFDAFMSVVNGLMLRDPTVQEGY